MTSIRIPTTIEEAVSKLDGIEALLTAKGWERAAIVATFVDVGQRGSNPIPKVGLERAATFAARGIRGLSSDITVAAYARAWLDRFPRPEAGVLIELPSEKWPGETRTGTDGYSSDEGVARTIERMVGKHGAHVVAEALHVATARGEGHHEPRPPRISDRGKSAEELADDAYWVKVRAALHLLLELKVKLTHDEIAVPGDIAILMELLVPETDWDEALQAEIGNLS